MKTLDGNRIVHFCVCVRGLLGFPNRKLEKEWRGTFSVDGRKLMTAEEIRDCLMDQLSVGREVLPMGPPCPGFDYKTGCPGHPVDDQDEEATQ